MHKLNYIFLITCICISSQVNGQRVIEVKTAQYTVNPAARSTVLKTPHGLYVAFNGDAVRVRLNGAYKGEVSILRYFNSI